MSFYKTAQNSARSSIPKFLRGQKLILRNGQEVTFLNSERTGYLRVLKKSGLSTIHVRDIVDWFNVSENKAS